MKVLLRHKGTHLYHSGWGSWSVQPRLSTDFGSVERAIQRAKAESLDNVEIVVSDGDAQPDQILQVPKVPPKL